MPRSNKTQLHGWQGLAKLLGSVTLVQAIGFVLLPLLSRYYTKEDYGILGTIMAIVGLTTLMANGRYDQAIFVAPIGGRIRLLRMLGIGINLALTLVLTLLCLVAPYFLAGTSYERILPYLFIVPLTTLCSGLFSILAATANAYGQYGTLGIAGIIQGYLNNGLKVLCGYLSMGVWGFALAFNTGLAAAAAFCGVRNPVLWLRSVTWRRLLVAAHHYRSFPKFTIGQGVVGILIASLLPLMLPNYYTTEQIGLITMLYMITRRPVQVYSDAASRVYARRMVEAHELGNAFLPEMNRLSLRILAVSVLVWVVFPWFADSLITAVLGDQWTELGSIITHMIPFLGMMSLIYIFEFIPDVVKRQRDYWLWQSTRLVAEILLIVCLAPRMAFVPFLQTYFYFSTFTYVLLFVWFYRLARAHEVSARRTA